MNDEIKKPLQMTKEEIYKKISEQWDFEKIIEPYREGGTETKPVTRTWGLVIDWLHVKKRYPIEVIGQAILLVMQKIKTEGHFKGDGSFGSAGNQFDQALRATCEAVVVSARKKEAIAAIGMMRSQSMALFMSRIVFDNTPWFVKMFSGKYWKFRKLRKKDGAS